MSGAALAARAEAGLLRAQGATGPAVAAVLLQRGAPTGDAADPIPGALEGFACTAVETKFKADEIPATLVGTITKKLLIGASSLAIEPNTTHRMNLDGKSFKVEMVEGVQPAGVPLLWKVYLSGPGGPADVYVPGVEAQPIEAFQTFVVDHTDDVFSLVVPANTRTALPFNFTRTYTNGPAEYDSHDFFPGGEFDPIGSDPGGQYEIEITMDVTPTVIDTNITLSMDIGSPDDPIESRSVPIVGAVGVPTAESIGLDVYSRETFQANNGTIYIEASNAVTLTNARAKVTVERVS